MPRASSSLKSKVEKPAPFQQQLKQDELTAKYGLVSQPGRRNKKSNHQGKDEDEIAQDAHQDKLNRSAGIVTGGKAGGGKSYVDPKLSRNILRLAREQQDELEREELEAQQGNASTSFTTSRPNLDFDDDDDDDEEEDGDGVEGMEKDDGELSENDQYPEEEYEEIEIDEKDRELLERFGNNQDDDQDDEMTGGRRLYGNKTLADLIMDKIDSAGDQKEELRQREERGEGMRMPPGINPKVIEVYTK